MMYQGDEATMMLPPPAPVPAAQPWSEQSAAGKKKIPSMTGQSNQQLPMVGAPMMVQPAVYAAPQPPAMPQQRGEMPDYEEGDLPPCCCCCCTACEAVKLGVVQASFCFSNYCFLSMLGFFLYYFPIFWILMQILQTKDFHAKGEKVLKDSKEIDAITKLANNPTKLIENIEKHKNGKLDDDAKSLLHGMCELISGGLLLARNFFTFAGSLGGFATIGALLAAQSLVIMVPRVAGRKTLARMRDHHFTKLIAMAVISAVWLGTQPMVLLNWFAEPLGKVHSGLDKFHGAALKNKANSTAKSSSMDSVFGEITTDGGLDDKQKDGLDNFQGFMNTFDLGAAKGDSDAAEALGKIVGIVKWAWILYLVFGIMACICGAVLLIGSVLALFMKDTYEEEDLYDEYDDNDDGAYDEYEP